MSGLPDQAVDWRVIQHAAKNDGCGCERRGGKWWLCPYHGGLNDGLAMCAAEIETMEQNVAILADESVTVREMEMKIRDGSLDLSSVLGPEGGSPAMKLMCGVILNIVLGDDNEEPPNYRGFELSFGPAGERLDRYRLWVECVKPGGKTSHEIRQELERAPALTEVDGVELCVVHDGLLYEGSSRCTTPVPGHECQGATLHTITEADS